VIYKWVESCKNGRKTSVKKKGLSCWEKKVEKMNGNGRKSEEGMKCERRRKEDAVRVDRKSGENGSKKRKAAWEDAEMDPEIQHLIETIWEIDNCPSLLTGQISVQIKPPRPKLQRVYKIQDLMPRTHQGSSSSL